MDPRGGHTENTRPTPLPLKLRTDGIIKRCLGSRRNVRPRTSASRPLCDPRSTAGRLRWSPGRVSAYRRAEDGQRFDAGVVAVRRPETIAVNRRGTRSRRVRTAPVPTRLHAHTNGRRYSTTSRRPSTRPLLCGADSARRPVVRTLLNVAVPTAVTATAVRRVADGLRATIAVDTLAAVQTDHLHYIATNCAL